MAADDGTPKDDNKTGGRGEQNEQFLGSAFLYGGNAAYLEQMQAAFAKNPASVPESWQTFFRDLDDNPADAQRNADGASWKRTDWPKPEHPDNTAAFDGNWALIEPQLKNKIKSKSPNASAEALGGSVKDSISALMMIRAYRMRGHLAAELDPLGLESRGPQPELDPASYGFADKDMDRAIFIDGYLGLESATPRQMLDILKRTYCALEDVEHLSLIHI